MSKRPLGITIAYFIELDRKFERLGGVWPWKFHLQLQLLFFSNLNQIMSKRSLSIAIAYFIVIG